MNYEKSSTHQPFGSVPNAHRCRPRRRTGILFLLCALACAGPLAALAASPPVVVNVTAVQRSGTKLVDIDYTISDQDSVAVNVNILVSSDSGATWTVPAHTCTDTMA